MNSESLETIRQLLIAQENRLQLIETVCSCSPQNSHPLVQIAQEARKTNMNILRALAADSQSTECQHEQS